VSGPTGHGHFQGVDDNLGPEGSAIDHHSPRAEIEDRDNALDLVIGDRRDSRRDRSKSLPPRLMNPAIV
jgi:hypothetical protein